MNLRVQSESQYKVCFDSSNQMNQRVQSESQYKVCFDSSNQMNLWVQSDSQYKVCFNRRTIKSSCLPNLAEMKRDLTEKIDCGHHQPSRK